MRVKSAECIVKTVTWNFWSMALSTSKSAGNKNLPIRVHSLEKLAPEQECSLEYFFPDVPARANFFARGFQASHRCLVKKFIIVRFIVIQKITAPVCL